MYDIIIIGAGLIGTAIARELSRYDLKIAVLEKGNDLALGSTKANSGIIHGGYDAKHGSLKARFCVEGKGLYEAWNQELEFGLRWIGALVHAFSKDDLAALHGLINNGTLNGVKDLSLLNKEQIRALEPNINPLIQYALFCPKTGLVSPYELAIALAENAYANGVEFFLSHEVRDLSLENPPTDAGGLSIIHTSFYPIRVQTDKKEFKTKYVINAAGLFSDDIAYMATKKKSFTIEPRKGHYYVFRRGYMPVNHILFSLPTERGKGVLVSPTYHGNLIIGPDAVSIQDKHDTRPSQENLDYIAEVAKQTIPSLDLSQKIRSYAGIRASASTHDFILGPVDLDATHKNNYEGLINVAGIESPGLTSAPALAKYIIKILLELTTKYQNLAPRLKTDFIAHRRALIPCQLDKQFLPMQDINRLAQLEPNTPNRIVCRCEQVSEQIIIEALNRGPLAKSIDAIKRRTRASMGICQGKFCRPRIRAIMAKYLGLNEDQISEN